MSRFSAFIMLAVATAAFCLLAGGASATEPNDAASNATPITVGSWGPFDIDPVGDVDWYTFVVAERATVRIVINGSSGDPDLYLYDANQSYVDYNSYDQNYPWPALDEVLQPGTYFAVVADEYGYNNFTGYFITLQITPPIPLVEGSQGPFNVNSSHPEDWFVFDVTEGSNVQITLNGSSGDPEVYLYDQNFSYLRYNDDYYGLWSYLTVQLNPGTYYLLAQSHSSGSVVNYYVSLERVSVLGPDGNGLRYNATLVHLGMNGPFDISYSGDVDWYVITFPYAGIATFETNGSSGSTYLSLYDQNGSWMAQDWSSGSGSFSYLAATVEGQAYYMDIESPYALTLYNYTLEIQLVPLPPADLNDDPASADPVSGGSYGPYSLIRYDADWYVFVASQPGSLTAETNGVHGGAGITIQDAQGTTLVYGSNTGNASYQRATVLVDTGTYFIEVQMPYSILAVTEYNLTVTFTPWVSLDGDDFRSEAQRLAPGLNGPYSITPSVDADWYYFLQEATGAVVVQVYGGSSRATIELYNETGAFYSGGTYGVQQISLSLQPGRWHLRATSVYGSYTVGEYYLNLTLVDTTDPAIVIAGPTNGTQVDNGSVRISGRTEAGSRVWIGAEEVFVDINGSFSAMVPVVIGQNAITVTCEDAAGNTAVTIVQVTGITLSESLQNQLNTANANLASAQAQAAASTAQAAAANAQLSATQRELDAAQSRLDTQNGTLVAAQREADAQRGSAMVGYLIAGLAIAAAALIAVLVMRKRPPQVATQVMAPVAPAQPVVVQVPPPAPAEAPKVAETPAPVMLPTPTVGSFSGLDSPKAP